MTRRRYWEPENKRTPEIQNTFNCTGCNKFRQIFGRRKDGKRWLCFECIANKEKEIARTS